jgi:hypothetical protein
MPVFQTRGIDPVASTIASEAFSRSWHFIQRDPVLAGHDRETLQAQLAQQIQHVMAADASERDPLRIANRAISKVREEMREPERRFAEIGLAS